MKRYILTFILAALCIANAVAQRKPAVPRNLDLSMPDSLPSATSSLDDEMEALDEVIEFPGNIRRGDNIVARGDSGSWLYNIQAKLDKACDAKLFETSQIGMCIYDLTDNQLVYAINPTHRMRPASSMKVVTAVTGLNYLGGDYQFTTRLYTTGSIVDSLHTLRGNVYVVGGMDPKLGATDLSAMAACLKNAGIDSIRGRIYMDVSMRKDEPMGWGWCWDDGYGPLTALMYDAHDTFAANWLSALKAVGIWVENVAISKATLPLKGVTLRLTRRHSIDDILKPMLKNSNNTYAESMFYNLAALSGKKNATRKEAESYVNQLITKFGYKTGNYQIADGSGVSLYDYVTPQLLVRFLRHAWSNTTIREHFYPALPIAGVDGTLASRMKTGKATGNVHAKTGTVNGVSSLTGYVKATNGHDLAFSIINMGIVSSSTGRQFQDKICEILASTKETPRPVAPEPAASADATSPTIQ